MDASTVSTIMNMATVQNLNSQTTADAVNGGSSQFSGILASMMGTNNTMAAINADGTVNYAALLSNMTGGMTLQDVQAQMLMQALHDMTKADKPLVTDPVLAQLVEKLDGAAGGQDAGMADVVKQIQDRLRDMLEEDGATMAGLEALAIIGNLVPAHALAGVSGAANSGEAALEMMLQASPQRLMELLGVQAQQSTDAQQQSGQTTAGTQSTPVHQSAKTQAVQVLPQGSNAASTAQLGFANVAQAVQQATPQSTAPVGEIPVQQAAETDGISVEVQAGEGGRQLSQMLQTGQAQSSFAGAVRTVKEQMPDNAAKAPDVDVDELQKQVDSTDLTARIQTSDVVKAAEELRGAQPTLQAQLQQAVARGLENGQERIVVKLNPAELGEVTLEMRKAENGGFTLNIIAKNPETQRLLAGDIAQLQQNLRPMRVEVQSVVTEQQFQAQANGQQFGGQHQRTWQEMHGAAYYGDEPLTPGETPLAEPPAAVLQSALDAYI